MKRIAFLALVLALAAPAGAHAAATNFPLLRPGSSGTRVKDLQWLLGGHKPSVYRYSTYGHAPSGYWGKRTTAAVLAMKWRLGYPYADAHKATFGNDLYRILTGRARRPTGWLVRATKRLAAQRAIERDRASSRCARRIVSVARGEVGVHEVPWGSNTGTRVRMYQSVTGAYYAPWCVSFAAWVYRVAHIGFPHAWRQGIADNSAGVFYVVGWASRRGWLRAVPKAGYIVAFTDRLGHMGVVDHVLTSGFVSVEGNASNSVLQRYHPFRSRPMTFIAIPGCDGG